jgi:hypothetical protein
MPHLRAYGYGFRSRQLPATRYRLRQHADLLAPPCHTSQAVVADAAPRRRGRPPKAVAA